MAVARPRRWACHLATAGCWLRGVPERYVAGADTRGRQEGRPNPWSQQVIYEISGPEGIILDTQESTAMLGIQRCRTRIRCGSSTGRRYSIQADQLGFAD